MLRHGGPSCHSLAWWDGGRVCIFLRTSPTSSELFEALERLISCHPQCSSRHVQSQGSCEL